jgi:hypothetical protein
MKFQGLKSAISPAAVGAVLFKRTDVMDRGGSCPPARSGATLPEPAQHVSCLFGLRRLICCFRQKQQPFGILAWSLREITV